ncbi:MAG: hypothetical protein OEX02_09650 [Cyclobacteriaceae bacterium]|nr:hypothetical protein [Cyclobacteriaceae bacterium]
MSDENKDLENKDDELENGSEDWGDDDNFGLPEVEYKPLEREEEQETPAVEESEETTSSVETTSYEPDVDEPTADDYDIHYADDEDVPANYDEEPEKKSKAGLIVTIIIIVVLLGGGGAGYVYWYKPKMEIDNKYQAQLSIADELFGNKSWTDAIKAYTVADSIKPDEEYPEKQIAMAETEMQAEKKRQEDEAARLAAEEAARLAAEKAKTVPGEVETLTARTGKYYLVVTTNLDGDLAMDYAKRLSKQGVNARLLAPVGKSRYHRVAVAEGDTQADVESVAAQLGGNYTGSYVYKY